MCGTAFTLKILGHGDDCIAELSSLECFYKPCDLLGIFVADFD
jgi:hypothetical protein